MSSSASRKGGVDKAKRRRDTIKAVVIFFVVLAVLLFLNAYDWFGLLG